MQHPQLDLFVNHFIHCLLWSETDSNTDTPLDQDYNEADVSAESRTLITRDCSMFLHLADTLIRQSIGIGDYIGVNVWEYSAHDFCLTRNGHGAGFWDRNLGELGKQLTAISKQFVEMAAFVNDQGEIEVLDYGRRGN